MVWATSCNCGQILLIFGYLKCCTFSMRSILYIYNLVSFKIELSNYHNKSYIAVMSGLMRFHHRNEQINIQYQEYIVEYIKLFLHTDSYLYLVKTRTNILNPFAHWKIQSSRFHVRCKIVQIIFSANNVNECEFVHLLLF